jgi:exopolysaccharide biosynthesis polyprenyl glycosylphosphotransferase
MRCLHDPLRTPEPVWAPLAAAETDSGADRGAVVPPAGAASRPGSARTVAARLDAVAKRALDVVGALVLLVLLAPLLVLIALAVRLDSPGPALFRQTRAGRHGRPFQMLKFRSMYVDADERVHAAYMRDRIRNGLPLLKLQHDPRVTRVGRWLRATSLDELPQLINVLRGEMSLVGPRPALPYEVELYDDRVRRRLAVLPGITGLAQVCSRGRGTLHEYTRYDLEYVERRSLWLDLWILARTIPAVLRREGAG